MKPLNKREVEVAKVAADLLMKGSPETRIAEYCLLKKMTSVQVFRFLERLPTIPENMKLTIHNAFNDRSKGWDFDRSRVEGKVLRNWLEQNKY